MISNKQKDNLFNMIYNHYCQIELDDQHNNRIYRYDFLKWGVYGGLYEIIERGNVIWKKEKKKVFDDEKYKDIDQEFAFKGNPFVKYINYLQYCIQSFTKEIKSNLIFIIPENKQEYLSTIDTDIAMAIDDNQRLINQFIHSNKSHKNYFDYEEWEWEKLMLSGEVDVVLTIISEIQIGYLMVFLRDQITPLLNELPHPILTPEQKTIKEAFKENKFFELPLVKTLSNENKSLLINNICGNELPYQIAMLDFLGFDKFLLKHFSYTKKQLYTNIAEILGANTRNVKGNLLVLNEISKENKSRYTAHLQKEIVKKDYKKMK